MGQGGTLIEKLLYQQEHWRSDGGWGGVGGRAILNFSDRSYLSLMSCHHVSSIDPLTFFAKYITHFCNLNMYTLIFVVLIFLKFIAPPSCPLCSGLATPLNRRQKKRSQFLPCQSP